VTNPIIHPTVVWDRNQVGYDLRYDSRMIQEDTELWLRFVSHGYRLENLPDVLMDYTQPMNYCRPRRVWRGGLESRLKHWRLVRRYPFFLAGIALRLSVVLMPKWLIDAVTRRNRLSDRLRSISGERKKLDSGLQ
jgi:hypothetical protein